jgi:hypothetical protein
VPPLALTGWLGIATVAIAGFAWLRAQRGGGQFRHVRDGIAVPGRLVRVEKGEFRANKEAPVQAAFVATVELRGPDGKLVTFNIWSPPFPLNETAEHAFAVEPGATVTAIWLPGQFPATLTLYGFLGITAESQLVRRDRPRPITRTVKPFLVGAALVVGLVLALQAFTSYETLDGDAAAVAGVIAVFVGAALAVWAGSGKPADRTRRILSAFFLGGFAVWFLGFAILNVVNGALDASPPVYDTVEIVEFWQETHTKLGIPLLRDYSIEYRSGATKKKKATTPRHIALFESCRLGAREIHRGFLGWSWVKEVHPAQRVEGSDGQVEILHEDGRVEEVTLAR